MSHWSGLKVSDFQSTVSTGPSPRLVLDILWLPRIRVILQLGRISGGWWDGQDICKFQSSTYLPSLDAQCPEAHWAPLRCLQPVGSAVSLCSHPCKAPLIHPSFHFLKASSHRAVFARSRDTVGSADSSSAVASPFGSSVGVSGSSELLQGLTTHAGGSWHLLSQPGFRLSSLVAMTCSWIWLCSTGSSVDYSSMVVEKMLGWTGSQLWISAQMAAELASC